MSLTERPKPTTRQRVRSASTFVVEHQVVMTIRHPVNAPTQEEAEKTAANRTARTCAHIGRAYARVSGFRGMTCRLPSQLSKL